HWLFPKDPLFAESSPSARPPANCVGLNPKSKLGRTIDDTYSVWLLRPSHAGSTAKSSRTPLIVTSSIQSSPPEFPDFMTSRIPKRLKAAPSALCPSARLRTAVWSSMVAVTTPRPPLALGSDRSDHRCTAPLAANPMNSERSVFASRRVGKPRGSSPPARQRPVAYSTHA